MDWQKVWVLLDVVHKTIGVPKTEKLRDAALAELAELNEPKVDPALITNAALAAYAAAFGGKPAQSEFELEPGAPEPENGARRI